ncbi:RNA polymerase sigma factor [Thalassomonas actiniarum]|uniref:Sigma-70 family RNA polymerase sigma factor n=1 Tax=Thalassomonas actiniarum TaxID=485447 RepID=A0AAF0C4R6_9GAMM|nr:sigma-70 family RNA polymerase sigma factor [Thalassomonas actiniarum]WDE00301.1 sigma-70 family RNA polymerase sigma factor [Thalassomonas actiniarum]
MDEIETLVNELYKSQSSRLLAVLTRIFGPHNLSLAEDVLQEAFSKALIHWREKPLPDNPQAWLMRTAKNQALDVIRSNKTRMKFSQELSFYLASEWTLDNTLEQEFQEDKIKDDQLRMIFMCCHEDIKPENRLPFILKTLCGFSIPAVARALVLPVATVKKRLLRTREKLKSHSFSFPEPEKLAQAMDTVHTVLYLFFNEGFHSSDGKQAINIAFCHEAIALVNLLAGEADIVNQDSLGLLALMHFHLARAESRLDAQGYNIPIDLQDRSLWEQKRITLAKGILSAASAVRAGASGRFFIEALIAREHCQCADFGDTNWPVIIHYYQQLIDITASPVAELNQAVAIGYSGKLSAAIEKVEKLQQNKILKNSHLPPAILAHFNAKAGNAQQAYAFAQQSKRLGGTPHEQQMMMAQVERLLNQNGL